MPRNNYPFPNTITATRENIYNDVGFPKCSLLLKRRTREEKLHPAAYPFSPYFLPTKKDAERERTQCNIIFHSFLSTSLLLYQYLIYYNNSNIFLAQICISHTFTESSISVAALHFPPLSPFFIAFWSLYFFVFFL